MTATVCRSEQQTKGVTRTGLSVHEGNACVFLLTSHIGDRRIHGGRKWSALAGAGGGAASDTPGDASCFWGGDENILEPAREADAQPRKWTTCRGINGERGTVGSGAFCRARAKSALRVCSRHVAATRRSWPAPSAGQRRGARPPLRSVDRERRLFHLFFSPSYGAGTREAQRPQRLLRRAAWLTNALGLRSSGARFLPGAVSVARRWGV